MNRRNRKSLCLIVGGIALAAFMISVVAAQQQKRAAQAPTTTAQGTTAANALAGAQKANVGPSQFVLNKQTPVKYTAFTLADVTDTKTGKAAAATDMVTGTNGKQIPAAKYLAAINNLEQALNAAGYSLRSTTQTKVTIQSLPYNKQEISQQAAALKGLPAASSKARAVTLASVQQEYQTALKTSATAEKAATATEPNSSGNQSNAPQKGTKRNKPEGANNATAGATAGSATTGDKSPKTVAKIPPGAVGIGINQAMQPFTTTKSYDKKWGDASIATAELSASITFKGDANSASLSTLAKATGSLFGHSEDLAVASAALAAPKTGNLTANLKITILGSDQVVVNKSEAVSFNQQDSNYKKSLPDSWKVSINVPIIGPISVEGVLGVKGTFTMPYELADTPGQTLGFIDPNIQATVYGEAAIGVGDDDTGALLGIEGDLTLLNNDLLVYASASEGTDTKGTFVNYAVTSYDKLATLSGHVYAFAKVNFHGIGHEWDTDVLNFPGLTASFSPLEESEKVYLKPVSVMSNPGLNTSAK